MKEIQQRITIREGQAVLAIRLSPKAFEAFEACRQSKSDAAGVEVSRNALGIFLIEQQLLREGKLHETTPLTRSRQRISMRTRLERLEAEVANMKEKPVATLKTTLQPFFE